jgi:hypothetical protein
MTNDKFITTTEFITPTLAMELLRNAAPNRPKSNTKIIKFATDMKAGKWMLTHQGIAISSLGRLLDGQNRLHAIVYSGIPIWMSVTRNVPEQTYSVIDTGTAKTAANALFMTGLAPRQSRIIAASIPYCVSYDKQNFPTRQLPSSIGNTSIIVLEYFNSNPKLVRSADFIQKMPRKDNLISEGMSCFFHYCAYRVDTVFADVFMRELLTGDGVESDSIVFELRKQLISSRISNRRLIESVIIRKVIGAHNYRKSGKYSIYPRQALLRVESVENPRFL